MAIYKHSYASYTGPLTARWPRFFILTRYSYGRLLQSKFLVLFLALCMCYPLACLAFIYLVNNTAFLMVVNFRAGPLTAIDGRFFYYYCVVQGTIAYLVTALVGPSLVSPDLVNGGLPLYLCRPFTRAEYVAGKLSVLVFMLSLVTWIPGLCLFAVQASLAGWSWMTANIWLAWAILLASLIWIAVLSLIALALSAWIKWRIAAGALVLAVFFAGAGGAAAVNSVLRTSNGSLIDLNQVVHTIWAELFRYDSGTDIPVSRAWGVLLLAGVLCTVLLVRRIRAFEVVK
jgi:ABC-2 type transport system permease protein